ncbi:TetR/AcrR family transcriptional regulator [Sporosarcina sp. FSL K6-3457]|uniref:TetR/AcrR family transcriptional regulator n=1 Tax=Sporosarcina sp. FSL K6-3457 TaxID=2978204 RepID=UPI0030FCB849
MGGANIARNRHPEKTIEKILNVSRELFFEKGYDNTTMQDIINQGLSKGAIYHHFKSKKEIFERIMQGIGDDNNYVVRITNTHNANALERLRELLYIRLTDEEKIKLLQKAKTLFEDPKVFGELYQLNMKYTTEQIKEFINQGNEDSSMNCSYVEETTELITLFFSVWVGTSLYNVNQDDFKTKVEYYGMLFKKSGVDLIDERLYTVLLTYHEKIIKVA